MKKYLPSLYGLRALSVLLVIFSHIEMYLRHEYFVHVPKVFGLLFDGQLGVTVFFVISGYLITTLLLKEEAATGTVSLKNFYARRTLRIFPAFYFLLLTYAVLQFFGILHLDLVSWASSITYTKDFNWNRDMVTAHAWSLSIEEQFYLCWPFAFCFFKTSRRRAAWLIVVLAPLLRGIFYLAGFNRVGFDDFSLFQRMDALMWGCLFALYDKELRSFVQKQIHKRKALATVPFLVIVCMFYMDIVNLDYHLRMGVLLKSFGQTIGTFSCVAIGFVLLISMTYEKNLWFQLLNSKPLVYIGKLSYSLYLWQQYFFFSPEMRTHSVLLNCVFIFAAANGSYFLVEKPFLAWKENFETRRKAKLTKKEALVG